MNTDKGTPSEPAPDKYPRFLCQGCGKYLFGRTTGTCNWCGTKI